MTVESVCRHVQREGGQLLALLADRLRLVLADVLRLHADNLQPVLAAVARELVSRSVAVGGGGARLVDRSAVLQPVQLQQLLFCLAGERGRFAGGQAGGGGVLAELWRGDGVAGDQHVDGARAERLAGIVECLAGVGAGVLREDFGDLGMVWMGESVSK